MSLAITILLLGVLASVSPSTIVVFILLLATTRARVNAAAFLIGWTVSLVLVFSLSYLAGGARITQQRNGQTSVEAIEILLGLALLVVGIRQWRYRRRPRQESSVTKGLTTRFKNLSPWQASIVGVLEQPWTLTAAAAVVVLRHHGALLLAVVALFLFTLVSTATVTTIYVYFARRPGEAEIHLSSLKDRVVAAGPTLFAVVAVLVGVYLTISGSLAIAG
jgi:hypothetical protein